MAIKRIYGTQTTSAQTWVTADAELAFSETAPSTGSNTVNLKKNSSTTMWAWTSDSGSPNFSAWVADADVSLDLSAFPTGLSLAATSQALTAVDSTATSNEDSVTLGAWSSTTGTGIKTRTYSAGDFASISGASTRVGFHVDVTNADTKNGLDATVDFSSNDTWVEVTGQSTVSGSFTADAHINATVADSFTADAYVKVIGYGQGSFTADAQITYRYSGSFTADAQITASPYTLDFVCGAECMINTEDPSSTGEGWHWVDHTGGGTVDVNVAAARSGYYGWQFTTSATTNVLVATLNGFGKTSDGMYGRLYFKAAATTYTTHLATVVDDAAATHGPQLNGSTLRFALDSASTFSTTNNVTIVANRWYGVEWELDLSGTGVTCKWRVWDEFSGWSTSETFSDTGATGTAFDDLIGIGSIDSTTATIDIDDIALATAPAGTYYDDASTNGVTGHVLKLNPYTDGTHSAFTAGDFTSSGGSLSTTSQVAYKEVDTYDLEASTSYIESTTNAATTEYVEFILAQDPWTDRPGSVKREQFGPVRGVVFVRGHDASSGTPTPGVVSISTDGGSNWVNLASAGAVTAASPKYLMDAVLSSDGAPWNLADTDEIRVRYYGNGATGAGARLTGFAAEVEYTGDETVVVNLCSGECRMNIADNTTLGSCMNLHHSGGSITADGSYVSPVDTDSRFGHGRATEMKTVGTTAVAGLVPISQRVGEGAPGRSGQYSHYVRTSFKFVSDPSTLTSTGGQWMHYWYDDVGVSQAIWLDVAGSQGTAGRVYLRMQSSYSTSYFTAEQGVWYDVEYWYRARGSSTQTTGGWRYRREGGVWSTWETVSVTSARFLEYAYLMEGIGFGSTANDPGVANFVERFDNRFVARGKDAYLLADTSGTNGREVHIRRLKPSADGTHSFTSSGDFSKSGSAAAPADTDLYTHLDAEDMSQTTEYILASTTDAGDYFEVHFEDSPTGVTGVEGVVMILHGNLNSSASDIICEVSDNGTDWSRTYFKGGSNASFYGSNTVGTVSKAPSGASWTPSVVNNLRARIRSADGTDGWRIYAVSLEVAYTTQIDAYDQAILDYGSAVKGHFTLRDTGVRDISAVGGATYYNDTLANTDLLAYWPLGDSGSTAVDVEGGYDFTYGAGVTKNVTGLIADSPTGAIDNDGTNVIGTVGTGLNPWSGSFTIECWAQTDSTPAVYKGLASTGVYNTNGWRFGHKDGTKGWTFWTNENGGTVNIQTGSAPLVAQAYHVVVTYNGTDTFTLYVDGEQVGQDTTGTYTPPATGGMQVGSTQSANHWDGDLDEFAVYDDEKSSTWVADRYALGRRAHDLSWTGATASADRDAPSQMSLESLYFDTANNQWASVTHTDFQVTGGALTAIAWVRPDTNIDGANGVIGCANPGFDGWLIYMSAATRANFEVNDGSSNQTYITSAVNSISQDEWHMLVMTHDGTNVRAYIDGDEIAESPLSAAWNIGYAAAAPFYVASWRAQAGEGFDGNIRSASVLTQVLTATQIRDLYEIGAWSDYTKFVQDNYSPQLHYAVDDWQTNVREASGGTVGAEVGSSTQVYAVEGPVVNGKRLKAARFSANSDGWTLGTTSNTQGGEMTAVYWSKTGTHTNGTDLFSQRGSAAGDYAWTAWQFSNSTQLQIEASTTGASWDYGAPSVTVGDNQWHMVAMGVDASGRAWNRVDDGTRQNETTYTGGYNLDSAQPVYLRGGWTANTSGADVTQAMYFDSSLTDAQLDALFAGQLSATTYSDSFTADAYIAATVSDSFTADANLSNTVGGSFSADAYIEATTEDSFTADAYIAAPAIEGSFTADAYIKATTEQNFTADAYVKATGSDTFSADAYVQRTFGTAFSADAYIASTVADSFSADAYVKQTFGDTFTADAAIVATVIDSFSADAYIFRAGLEGSFTANALITNQVSGSFTADAHITATVEGSFTADAYVQATVSGDFTADAYIQQSYGDTFTADAYIAQTYSDTFTADAYILLTTSDTFTADAHITNTIEQTFTADAYVQQTYGDTFTADAYVQNTLGDTFTADAYIYDTFSGSFTVDAEISPDYTQVAIPDADIATTGWTTTPLWSKLGEVDDTYVEATAS